MHNHGERILNLLPDAALQVDAACGLVARNDLAAAMFGPAGPLEEAPLTDALGRVPGFRDWLSAPGDDVFHGRLQVRRSNLVPVTVELTARRVAGEGAVCILHELDREHLVGEAQRYFDVAFDAAPIGMALFNTDGEYVRVNAALCAFLGRTEQELLGRRDQELTHPDDRQADVDAAWRTLRGEIHTWQCEKRFVRPDGGLVWAIANLTFLRDNDGNPMSWVGQFQDITERKALEAGLRERERHTRQILESAHDAFIAIDDLGFVTEWNRQAEATFGWLREEVLGREVAGLIVPERFREAYREGIVALSSDDGTLIGPLVEMTGMHRDGREFPLELTVSAHSHGDRQSFNAFLRDISERKRTQEKLMVAHSAAVEASRLKSEFVANMSHEIRTPLNGVIGMSGLLLGTDLTDEQREYADTIHASGDALMRLVDDILDFSKIEAGKLELDNVPFNLREVVEDVTVILAPAAHAKDVELVVLVDDDVPAAVWGDGNRVRQVLANLIGNAVKFTPGGEVAIRASTMFAGRDGALLHLEVRDTGIGIDPAALQRIFDSFSQADGSTTRRFGGTGLGLAICKQLVGLMGGEIGVDSTLGEGSTFWFTVPLVTASSDGPWPGTDLGGVRALVVDDNVTSRSALHSALSSWGVRCDAASDGHTALDRLHAAAASADPYRLVLLDSRMPAMGGTELARTLRSTLSLPPARLVMLLSSAAEREAAAHAGVDALVTKPVRMARLRDEIVRLVHGSPPVHEQPSAAGAEGAATAGERGRVLVADDNEINQLVAMRLLERRGFAVDVAADGHQALDRHERERYTAIFMDCQMPGLDGYETTAEIRRREGAEHRTPIIAMTASTMKGDRERCLAAGMDDYIGKPMRPEALDQVLSGVLTGGGPGREAQAIRL